MHAEGMSTRAIGEVVGASEPTVRRDLEEGASFDAPDTVTGTDGRTYPARRTPMALNKKDLGGGVSHPAVAIR